MHKVVRRERRFRSEGELRQIFISYLLAQQTSDEGKIQPPTKRNINDRRTTFQASVQSQKEIPVSMRVRPRRGVQKIKKGPTIQIQSKEDLQKSELNAFERRRKWDQPQAVSLRS